MQVPMQITAGLQQLRQQQLGLLRQAMLTITHMITWQRHCMRSCSSSLSRGILQQAVWGRWMLEGCCWGRRVQAAQQDPQQ
jgi:hypothetical protein